MTSTTRRALLGAIAASVPAMALAAFPQASEGIAPALAAKIAAYHAAEDAERAFYENVFNPITERCDAEILAVPHTNLGPIFAFGSRRSDVTTAERPLLQTIRQPDRMLGSPQYEAACRRFVAADDARDAEIARIKARYRYDDLNARSDQLAEADCAAFNAVLDHPAVTVADLAAKMSVVDQREANDRPRAWQALLADVRALTSGRA